MTARKRCDAAQINPDGVQSTQPTAPKHHSVLSSLTAAQSAQFKSVVCLAVIVSAALWSICNVHNLPAAQIDHGPFPGRTKWFVHCTAEDAECFVDTALNEWQGKKIRQHQIEQLWNGQTDAESCQLVQIIDGQVLLFASRGKPLDNPPWMTTMYDARIAAVSQLIRLAVDRLPESLPNTELAFCARGGLAGHDPTIPVQLPEAKRFPDFGAVKCHGSSAIPIPWFDVFRPPNDVALLDWDATVAAIKAHRDAHPWSSRKSQVVFRGGSERTCSPDANADGFSSTTAVNKQPWTNACGRPLAMSMVRGDARFDFEAPPRLDMPSHEQYKYVMYLHGHCHWANRLRRLLFMGAAIFKQVGLCEEFYALRLRPWVHYIPVDYHFSNLTASVEWALSHEEEVQAMIQRMHNYADKFNTAEFAVAYTAALLRRYARLLDYEVQLRPGAHTVIQSG